ncbi:MAG TPA: D-alanyl-D-alanine carboxypeptidase family protein [Promicromonospora sp.]|nr:D-alanyl-D-alanine carboxypeptidase family protein [Promicromonospora sp.]
MSDEATTGPGFLRTLSHSVPRSYRLVAARRGRPRLLRSFVTGALATGLAAAVLFTASASVPGSGPAGAPGEPPIRLYGSIENVRVGETGAVPEGVTLAQVVAVLERAERMAQEQGAAFSPTVAQAAAELGMLYTTYQMQQLAFGRNNEGLRVEDAPERRDAVADENGAGGGKGDGDHADDGGGDDPDGPSKVPGGREDDESEPDGTAPAIEVSRGHGSVIDPRTDDRPAADTGHDDASGYAAGYVTYDQVVMAAVRLANMLDPSVPNALVEVEGITREGFSLRESLLDVVDTFGGSTAGYANGRIPVDVLCPLEFAPGHMLRCDAAERLTALSAEFEKEFGYPIPMTDSYRSYEMQVTLKGIKPHLAAIPGTSNHGWGLAVDLGNPIAGGHSPEYVWLRVHGPDYGWDNPSWARLDGAKPEPWHFEFFAAGSIPNRAVDPSDVGTWTPNDPDDRSTPHYKPPYKPKPSDKATPGRPGDTPPSQKPTTPKPKPGGKPTKPPATGKPTTPPPSDEPSEPGDGDPSDEPSQPGDGDPSDGPDDPDQCDGEAGDPADPAPSPSASGPQGSDVEDAGATAVGDDEDDKAGDDTCPPDEDENGDGDPEGTSTTTSSGVAAKQPDDDELAVVDDED